jgi:hypothetical protein
MEEKKEAKAERSGARNFYYIFSKEGKLIDFTYFDNEPTMEQVNEVIEKYEKKQRGEI